MQRPPKLAYFPHDLALKIASFVPNWDFLNMDTIIKNELDIVCNKKNGSIDDLYVKPVNFSNGVAKFLHDHKARFIGPKDEWER